MSEIRLFDFIEKSEFEESDYNSASECESDYDDSLQKAKKVYERAKYRYEKILNKRNKIYKTHIAIVGTERLAFETKCLTINTDEGKVNVYIDNDNYVDLNDKNLQGVIITYNPDNDFSRKASLNFIEEARNAYLPYIVLSLNGKMESIRQYYYHIENVEQYHKPLLDLISQICNIRLVLV